MKSNLVWFLVLLLAISCKPEPVVPPLAQSATQTKEDWPIRVYRFPIANAELFPDQSEPAVAFPAVPAETASAAEIDAYLKQSAGLVAAFFKANHFELPAGSLVVYDPAKQLLAARAKAPTQRRLAAAAASSDSKSVFSAKIEIVEDDVGNLLTASQETLNLRNHATILQRLRQRPSFRSIEVLTKQIEIGPREKLGHQDEFAPDLVLRFEKLTGRLIDATSVMAPQNTAAELMVYGPLFSQWYSVDYALKFPTPAAIVERGSHTIGQTTLDVPLIQNPEASVLGSLYLEDGMTCLIATLPQNEKGRSQAAFLALERGLEAVVDSGLLVKWITLHGEKLSLSGASTKSPDQVMIERRFFIPHGFESPSDPDKPRKVPSAMQILVAMGVNFPPGSQVEFVKPTQLLVKTTPEVMRKVAEIIVFPVPESPKHIGLRVRVVEGEQSCVEKLASSKAALDEALAAKQVTLVESFALLTCLDRWTRMRLGQNFSIVDKVSSNQEANVIEASLNTSFFGTEVRFSPRHTPNGGLCIECFWQRDTGEPSRKTRDKLSDDERNEFHHVKDKKFDMQPGGLTLLGTWEPPGKFEQQQKKIVQAAFLNADVVELEEE